MKTASVSSKHGFKCDFVLFPHIIVVVGEATEMHRFLLLRILKSSFVKPSWRPIFSPSQEKAYGGLISKSHHRKIQNFLSLTSKSTCCWTETSKRLDSHNDFIPFPHSICSTWWWLISKTSKTKIFKTFYHLQYHHLQNHLQYYHNQYHHLQYQQYHHQQYHLQYHL